MTSVLEYDEDGASVYVNGNCINSFGWYRDGSCIWRTVGNAPFTRNIIVSNSDIANEISTENGLVNAVNYVARLSGVAPENIQPR